MLLMTLISATLAVAQPAPVLDASARLSQPRAVSQLLDGRRWTCDADGTCLARGTGASQPVLRECRRFVARFGAVSRYARDGVPLTEAQLARCNAAAN